MSFTSPNKSPEGTPSLLVTQQIQDTIITDNLSDPVAAQYYPSDKEKIITANENPDPIGDDVHSPVTGIVHRHPDRVLLKITDTCAVYCRFCFRKESVGKGAGILNKIELDSALDYIKNNPQIREVIFSGGDPLTLSNRRLSSIVNELNKIDHLQFLRFHTRAPIVNPARIDQDFLDIINTSSKAIYIVFHINHVQEMNEKIIDVFEKLNMSKANLLSQSVLLRKVNDTVDALTNLFTTLVKHHVKPYYLHHPDLAPGTSHFRVSIQKGQELMRTLRKTVSGICLPSYVLDIPNGYGKIPINSSYIAELECGHYKVEDPQGEKHTYKEMNIQDD